MFPLNKKGMEHYNTNIKAKAAEGDSNHSKVNKHQRNGADKESSFHYSSSFLSSYSQRDPMSAMGGWWWATQYYAFFHSSDFERFSQSEVVSESRER